MRLRYVLAAVVLAAVAASARAQIGVYINPVGTRISNSIPDTGPFSFLGNGVTSRTFGGLDFGAYYNVTHGPGAKFGVDVRDTTVHSNNASLNIFSLAAGKGGKCTLSLQASALCANIVSRRRQEQGRGRAWSIRLAACSVFSAVSTTRSTGTSTFALLRSDMVRSRPPTATSMGGRRPSDTRAWCM